MASGVGVQPGGGTGSQTSFWGVGLIVATAVYLVIFTAVGYLLIVGTDGHIVLGRR